MQASIIHGFVGGGGGTEKTLLSIIETLTENNFTINLFTVSKPSLKINSGVKIRSVFPFYFPFFGLYQRYMESMLINKTKETDLVIQASGGLVLPRNSKQHIIIYCHHDFQNETEKIVTKYKGLWSLYYKPYYAISKRFVDQINNDNIHLVANSKYIQESIKKKFDKNSIVIYPPVELSEFTNDAIKSERTIVTISRYSQEKNLEYAIKVTNNIQAKHVIIGNTKTKANEIYYDKLQGIIDNDGKSGTLLLKNIKRRQVIEHLKYSKVYLHASPETFGISIVESIASGCIPIVPDNSAHKETVPFTELRFNPNNLDDAREKIENALSGKFDYLLESLQEHVRNFGKDIFKKSLLNYINTVYKS